LWFDNRSLYKDVVQKSPRNIRGNINLGNALVQNNEIDEGIRTYQAALIIAPDDPEVHYNLGTAYAAKGAIGEAVTHFQEAIKYYTVALEDAGLSRYRWKIKARLEKAYVDLGSACLLQGNVSEALNNYLLALQSNPGNAFAHHNLGVLYFRKGMPDAARLHLNKAHEIDPGQFPETFTEQELSLRKSL